MRQVNISNQDIHIVFDAKESADEILDAIDLCHQLIVQNADSETLIDKLSPAALSPFAAAATSGAVNKIPED